MGKAATEPGRQGSRPANEAEPPLKSLVEGPLSPTRSTNIAESSREPGGRLSAADELAAPQESPDQRLALMRRIQELELENALPERREAAKERKKVLRDVQNHSDSNTWLQNKVVELVSTQARLEKELIPMRRRENQAVKDRDEAKAEAQRLLAINSKLQELCRTLQQQNKDIVEQAKATVGQEQLSRQELTEKVGETLKSVTSKIEEQSRERELQEKQNAELRSKLNEIDESWGAREDLFAKQVEAREKEVALWRERGAQQQALLQTAAAREATLQEHLDGLRAQVGETGAALQHHMGSYAQYQEVIDRSNQALQQLQEADRGKEATIKALEKAKRIKDKQLKAAQQSLDQATEAFAEAVRHSTQLSQLVEAAGGVQQVQELPKLQVQKATLERLSRALQDENRQLKAQLPDAAAEEFAGAAAGLHDDGQLQQQSEGQEHVDLPECVPLPVQDAT